MVKMNFLKKIIFVLAIYYGAIPRVNSDLDLFCQSDLAECKCDFYTGTLSMDCSEMNLENVPDFSVDKVNIDLNSSLNLHSKINKCF